MNFKRYHPPHKALSPEVRNGAPLSWVRLQTDWYDDEDILDLPEDARWLWPALLALAGKSRPPGHIEKDGFQLAREMRMDQLRMEATLKHLWKRGRIRFSRPDEGVTKG